MWFTLKHVDMYQGWDFNGSRFLWLCWLCNNIEQGVQNSCWISKGLFLIQQHYSKNLELYDCVIYNTTTERYKGVPFGQIVLFWSTCVCSVW